MRIKAKCTIKHHPYYLSDGDIMTVADAAGGVMVACGWAENLDTGESRVPDTDPATLIMDNSNHATQDKVK